jgi:hypothetical protein
MSVITHRKSVEIPAAAAQLNRVASAVPAILGLVRKAIAASATLILRAADAFAEARMHRAAIEAELYLNRYKHASKNDDDLPIVR